MMILSIITQNTDNTPCITLYAGVSSWQGRGKSIRSFPLEPRLLSLVQRVDDTKNIFIWHWSWHGAVVDHDPGDMDLRITPTVCWYSPISRNLVRITCLGVTIINYHHIFQYITHTNNTTLDLHPIFGHCFYSICSIFLCEKSLIKIVTNSTLFCVTICVK